MSSLQFEKRVQFHVNAIPGIRENDRADYLRGGVFALTQKHKLTVDSCGVIDGSLSIGGLRNSATVINILALYTRR
ncbi:MAG: hypothetical protein MST10_04740 [Lentisphaeria bacterium]|nr:hypothetical protein [Lentisphaeria bacterium]